MPDSSTQQRLSREFTSQKLLAVLSKNQRHTVNDLRDISPNPSPMALHGVTSMGSQGVAECSSRVQSLLLLDSTAYVYTVLASAQPLVDQISDVLDPMRRATCAPTKDTTYWRSLSLTLVLLL